MGWSLEVQSYGSDRSNTGIQRIGLTIPLLGGARGGLGSYENKK